MTPDYSAILRRERAWPVLLALLAYAVKYVPPKPRRVVK